MKRLIPSVFCLFFLAGCQSGNPPPGTIDEARFVGLYADLLQESHRSRNAHADSATAARNAAAVFERHGVSVESFDATVSWYNEDIRRWQPFLEKVTAEMERRQSTPPPPR